jgi:hypothetical protein
MDWREKDEARGRMRRRDEGKKIRLFPSREWIINDDETRDVFFSSSPFFPFRLGSIMLSIPSWFHHAFHSVLVPSCVYSPSSSVSLPHSPLPNVCPLVRVNRVQAWFSFCSIWLTNCVFRCFVVVTIKGKDERGKAGSRKKGSRLIIRTRWDRGKEFSAMICVCSFSLSLGLTGLLPSPILSIRRFCCVRREFIRLWVVFFLLVLSSFWWCLSIHDDIWGRTVESLMYHIHQHTIIRWSSHQMTTRHTNLQHTLLSISDSWSPCVFLVIGNHWHAVFVLFCSLLLLFQHQNIRHQKDMSEREAKTRVYASVWAAMLSNSHSFFSLCQSITTLWTVVCVSRKSVCVQHGHWHQ